MSDLPARVPCTVVTGFLGAGKSTLLRHLMRSLAPRRLAVIVNEFGDVGFDGEFLRECCHDDCPGEAVVELANGCICCTVADDFVPALDALLALQPPVEHILIETSGLALPKPLVQAFRWPQVAARVTVDAVVAVVDGPALTEGQVLSDAAGLDAERADMGVDHDDPVEEVFEDQIACADLVLIAKADLLDADALAAVREKLARRLAPAVRVVPMRHGEIDPAIVTGLGIGVEASIDGRWSHHDGLGEHDHDDFDSFVVTLPAIADPAELAARIGVAAATHGVLRVKGWVEVAGRPMRLAVQAVGPRVGHAFDRPWAPGEDRRSRLVVIGERGPDRAAIAALLGGA